MIGNTRDKSSIRLQKQVNVKRESHELEEEAGTYVSKPGTNACIASNHKSLHVTHNNEAILPPGNRQMRFQVDCDRQKGSHISILVKGGRQKGLHILALVKKNRQRGFQVFGVKGDRQKGSRDD
ncbi:hypothetical protein D5086_002093 [Populus alba]|uniref:Uncharacterized protein n=1 Tax=Populus alba TaxID=43335 RepID=A0ACC4D1T4_POPAL